MNLNELANALYNQKHFISVENNLKEREILDDMGEIIINRLEAEFEKLMKFEKIVIMECIRKTAEREFNAKNETL